MNIVQAIILGIVQGATEFIPISSSAHLVLVPWLFKWPAPGLAFDTVLHLGTLLAVVTVFWQDLFVLATAWVRSTRTLLLRFVARIVRPRSGQASVRSSNSKAPTTEAFNVAQGRLAWWIILGTIPAALMGALWEDQFEALFHSPLHVAALLLVTGLWLVVAERFGHKNRDAQGLYWWQALLVGLAQGCAIAPGISRSGATIGAGLLLGLRREAATRFSFLLSTPIILGAGLLQVSRLLSAPGLSAGLLPLGLGFLGAFLTGYACIRFLLGYVKTRGLTAFASYCWLVGLGAIAIYLVR